MNLRINILREMDNAGVKTICELSKKIGITRASIRNVFIRNDCKLSTLLKISEVLGCNVADLIK